MQLVVVADIEGETDVFMTEVSGQELQVLDLHQMRASYLREIEDQDEAESVRNAWRTLKDLLFGNDHTEKIGAEPFSHNGPIRVIVVHFDEDV